jgi:flagella basal body P-ring formation protein FlgA
MNSSGSRRKSLGQVLSIAFFSLCFFSGDSDIAHGQQFPISMRVRASSTVTGAKVTIDDIALVESSDQKEDGKAVSVKKVILLDSLEPGGERHLSAYQILDQLRGESIDPSSIGYSIPEQVVVRRAGREITKGELQSLVDEYLKGSGREATIRTFSHDGTTRLFAGAATLRIVSLERQRVGLSRIAVEAKTEDGESVQIQLVSSLDEFMYVPVASRPLSVGNVVNQNDLVMARLDMTRIPRDVAAQSEGVVGHTIKRGIGVGDLFRAPDLSLPFDVTAGSSVTLRYVGRGFKATASGSALEAGRVGGAIRVRNESSKRIVEGTVVEPGLVEVR